MFGKVILYINDHLLKILVKIVVNSRPFSLPFFYDVLGI